MACVMVALQSIVKVIVSVTKRSAIVKQVDALRELYNEELENCDERDVVNRVIASSVFIGKLVFILNIALGLVFNFWIFPIMIYNYIYHKDDFTFMLPFYVYLPYEVDSWLGWIVPMVSLNLGSYCSIAGIVTADTHFYISVAHTCSQLKVVAHRLRTLQLETEESKPIRHIEELEMHNAKQRFEQKLLRDNMKKECKKINSEKTHNGKINCRLGDIIKRHQKIFKMAEDLENIYAPNFLFNFMLSSIVICLNGFIITSKDNTNKPQCVLLLSTVLIQIFILCMFGNMLIEASLDIRDAVWDCKWYNGDKRMAQHLLFIHKRAAKPMCVTAYKFSTVEYTSFARILSTSWSYFTLLSTMYD